MTLTHYSIQVIPGKGELANDHRPGKCAVNDIILNIVSTYEYLILIDLISTRKKKKTYRHLLATIL